MLILKRHLVNLTHIQEIRKYVVKYNLDQAVAMVEISRFNASSILRFNSALLNKINSPCPKRLLKYIK